MAKLWMSVGVAVIAALIFAFLLIGAATHWTLAIPVLPLGAAIYAIIRLWRGANAGVGYVTHLAKTELRNKTSLLSSPGTQPQKTPSGSL